MSLNETKAELRAMFESTGQMPNKRIIDMQHQVLELIGVEHKYGVSCLNSIPQTYANDRELHIKMNQFMIRANLAGR